MQKSIKLSDSQLTALRVAKNATVTHQTGNVFGAARTNQGVRNINLNAAKALCDFGFIEQQTMFRVYRITQAGRDYLASLDKHVVEPSPVVAPDVAAIATNSANGHTLDAQLDQLYALGYDELLAYVLALESRLLVAGVNNFAYQIASKKNHEVAKDDQRDAPFTSNNTEY